MIRDLILNLVFVFWFLPFWLTFMYFSIHRIERIKNPNILSQNDNYKTFLKCISIGLIPIVNIYGAYIIIQTIIYSLFPRKN